MKAVVAAAMALLLAGCSGEEFGDLKAGAEGQDQGHARQDRPASGGEALRARAVQGFRSTRSFQQLRRSSWSRNQREPAAAAGSSPISTAPRSRSRPILWNR